MIKDAVIDTVASAKVTAATSVGLSAPFWVEYLETVINPVVALLVALFTGCYMFTKFMNGLYEWRSNWQKRIDKERENLHTKRKTDEVKNDKSN